MRTRELPHVQHVGIFQRLPVGRDDAGDRDADARDLCPVHVLLGQELLGQRGDSRKIRLRLRKSQPLAPHGAHLAG